MPQVMLSGFGDEIAEDFEQQLVEMLKMGINNIALRNLWGTNVLKLSRAQKKKALGLLRQYGMGISEIGSPVGKVRITGSWKDEWQEYLTAVEAAHYFKCPRIRIFSYLMPKGKPVEKYRGEVIRRLRAMAEHAESEGIMLLHENDEGMYGASGLHVLDLLNEVDSPSFKLAFDPSNFVTIGSKPFTQWWDMLAPHVVHLHVKDQKMPPVGDLEAMRRHENFEREQTPAGEGDGEFPEIMKALVESGYQGYATMEPHLAVAGQFSGFSGPDLFAHATQKFRDVCDEAGMPHRQTRVGVIGMGFIGGFHCQALESVPEAHLVAVADEVESPGLKKAEKTWNVQSHVGVGNMLKRKDIDAVTICTPSGLHGKLGLQAMRAGKHVLTEKPIDIALKKADEMIGMARKKNLKLGVISQHRTDPGIIELKEAIESGALGKIVMAEAYIKWHRTQEYYDSGGWRGTWKLDGGGAMMNQGVHTIDMLQYVVGSPVKSVYANAGTMTHERIEVEDCAHALLQFENGALGMIVASTSVYPGMPERLEVSGSKGTIIVEGDRVTLREIENETKPQSAEDGEEAAVGASDPQAISNRGHVEQLANFCQAIRDDHDPLIPGEEGRKPLEIILAAYQSAKTGRRVTLPLKG